MKFPAPTPDFIPARFHGGRQTPGLIVLHSTVGPTKKGSARGVARFFATEDNPTSATYCVDEAEVIQCVGDHTVAYHCGYNNDSLAIEMCDYPAEGTLARWFGRRQPGDHKKVSRLRLMDPQHRRMLENTIDLTADLCLAYGIPPRFLGVKEVQAWDRGGRKAALGGITTHAVMSKAFRRSTHWDPGAWPRHLFMGRLRAAVAAKKHLAAVKAAEERRAAAKKAATKKAPAKKAPAKKPAAKKAN